MFVKCLNLKIDNQNNACYTMNTYFIIAHYSVNS
jgi:hypothetical protein